MFKCNKQFAVISSCVAAMAFTYIFCDGNLLYNTVSRGALYGGRGVRDNITMLGSIVLAVCVSQGNNVFNKKKILIFFSLMLWIN